MTNSHLFGVMFSLGFGVAYASIVFFTLASRAYDLDLVFSMYAAPLIFLAFVIGVVVAWTLYSSFAWFKVRRFRIRLSTLLVLIFLLAASLAPNLVATEGSSSIFGESVWYGWPLPAVGVNYLDTIEHEVLPATSTHFSWGIFWPTLLLDVMLVFGVLSQLAVILEVWAID